MWTLAFWKAAAERALKTAAQAAVLAVGSDSFAANALTFDWASMGGFALGGFVLSLLTSIATAANTGGNPSVGAQEVLSTTPEAVVVPAGDPDA